MPTCGHLGVDESQKLIDAALSGGAGGGVGAAGRSALVTGAARGIGHSVVTRLRAAGYRVVAVDVNPAVADLAEAGRVVPLAADVTDDRAPETVTDQSAYAMTKGGIVQLTRQLAIEYAATPPADPQPCGPNTCRISDSPAQPGHDRRCRSMNRRVHSTTSSRVATS